MSRPWRGGRAGAPAAEAGRSGMRAPLLALLLFLGVYAAFGALLGYPLFASDEYAYFIRGKFFGLDHELVALDPFLQFIDNQLYFAKLHLLHAMGGEATTALVRVLNAVEYGLAGLLLLTLFRRLAPNDSHVSGFVAFLLLPTAIYNFAVMPETDMVLLGCVLAWLAVVATPRAPLRAAAIAGVVLAVALLVKPHALAMLAALLVHLVLGGGSAGGGDALRRRVVAPLVLLASTWLCLVVLWRLLTGRLVLDPGAFLGLTFYGRSLLLNELAGDAAAKWLSVLDYFLANLVVMVLVFAPALAGAALGAWRVLTAGRAPGARPPEAAAARLDALALFTLLMLGAHLAMTAHFTAGAAILGAADAMRLHGRYLAPAVATLPFLTFCYLRQAGPGGLRAMAASGIVAAGAFVTLVVPRYRIYPWDNPLLFAFYQADNRYDFHFAGLLPQLGWGLAVVLAGGYLAAALWRRAGRAVLAAQLLMLLVYGHLLVLDWLVFHSRANADLVARSRAAATIVGPGAMGDGLLVTDRRFGDTAYILYALGNAPRVLLRPAGSVVSAADVGAARWVLVNGPYPVDIGSAGYVELGGMRLYAQNVVAAEAGELPELRAGEVHEVRLASPQVRTSGFNDPEAWGRWSAAPTALVQVGRKLRGRVELEFFAWTLPGNTSHPLVVSAGDATVEVRLSASGAAYRQYLDIGTETDTLRFAMPTLRPGDSHRDMGVALARLTLRRLPDGGAAP